jgi:phage tail-like protein
LNFFKHLIKKIMGQYPMPAYHFIVEWGGTRLGFTEVSGLEISTDVVEYREGSDPTQSAHKMPGLRKFTNITLKRGIIKGDNDFYTWMKTINLNQAERRDIVIKLLNENHEPVMIWKASNAFPVKLTGPVLKANANEVAIEELELAHEGLSIEVS